MPNQLSQSKRRQSLAEHEAVLAALTEIAKTESTTVMDLLRQAARELVRERTGKSISADRLRTVVSTTAPKMPAQFKSAAQLARYKRTLREFDQVLLDLGVVSPNKLQKRNSVAGSRRSVRIVDFDESDAPAKS